MRARWARRETPLVACRPIISGTRVFTIDVRARRNFYTSNAPTQDNGSILDSCRIYIFALAHKTRLAGFGGSVGLTVISGRNVFALAAALRVRELTMWADLTFLRVWAHAHFADFAPVA